MNPNTLSAFLLVTFGAICGGIFMFYLTNYKCKKLEQELQHIKKIVRDILV